MTLRKECGCIFGAECCGACKGEKRAQEVEERRRRGLPSEFPLGPVGETEEAAWAEAHTK